MEYVDLGFPSGKKWAKYNLGANSEEEYGLYFSWGETVGYTKQQINEGKSFDWANYKFTNGCERYHFIKYNSEDNKIILDLEDDAAYKMLGEHWRIPNKQDFEELITNTESSISEVNNVKGMKFISKFNKNYIFFPFAGFGHKESIYELDEAFYCWSSSVVEGTNGLNVYYLTGENSSAYSLSKYGFRYFGLTIRGIYVE